MTQADRNQVRHRMVAVIVTIAAIAFGAWAGPVGAQEPASYPVTDSAAAVPILEFGGSADDGLFVDEDVTTAGCNSPYCQCYPDGIPRDTDWGCGGSPFRTGPGNCDTWRVGPIWDSAFDGMVMSREDANLAGLEAEMRLQDPSLGAVELYEQFEYSPGGRLFLTGKIPRYVGYQLQFGYEGIEEWNSSIVFPKVPSPIAPTPPPPAGPPAVSERRTLDYRSSYHSVEMDVVRGFNSPWQPYGGFRFIRFAEDIRDEVDQVSSTPLPGDPPNPPVITADRLNLFDVKNDLVGAQVGFRRDLWRFGRRFSIQGFANMGLYVNMAKRANTMTTTTTQVIADNTAPPVMGDPINEARLDVSTATNTVTTEMSELAYVTEASLSGVCRINRCIAVRGGYQVLWMGGLHLAEDAYLFPNADSDQLLFQGWHVGAEYRR